eukprot:gene9906-3903_t
MPGGAGAAPVSDLERRWEEARARRGEGWARWEA